MLEGTLSAANHRGSSADTLTPAPNYSGLPLLHPDNHHGAASEATLHLPLHLAALSSCASSPPSFFLLSKRNFFLARLCSALLSAARPLRSKSQIVLRVKSWSGKGRVGIVAQQVMNVFSQVSGTVLSHRNPETLGTEVTQFICYASTLSNSVLFGFSFASCVSTYAPCACRRAQCACQSQRLTLSCFRPSFHAAPRIGWRGKTTKTEFHPLCITAFVLLVSCESAAHRRVNMQRQTTDIHTGKQCQAASSPE